MFFGGLEEGLLLNCLCSSGTDLSLKSDKMQNLVFVIVVAEMHQIFSLFKHPVLHSY